MNHLKVHNTFKEELHVETSDKDKFTIEEEYIEIPQKESIDSFNGELEEITLEEISEISDTSDFEGQHQNEDYNSDLVDEILKEIEMKNKNK